MKEIKLVDAICLPIVIIAYAIILLLPSIYIEADAFIQITILILYSTVLFKSFYKNGFFSIKSIFLMLLFLFCFSRIFLDLIGFIDMYDTIVGQYEYIWSDKAKYLTYLAYGTFLIFFYFIDFIQKNKTTNFEKKVINDNVLKLFTILFVLDLVVKINEYILISKIGYTNIYLGALNNGLFSKFGSLITLVFMLLFCYILSDIPINKQFFYTSILYLIISFLDALKGSRGAIVLVILFIIFYAIKFNYIKIKLCHLIFLALVSIPLLNIVTNMRLDNGSVDYSIMNNLFEFFDQSGGSINIVPYYIDHMSELSINRYPYFIEPFLRLPSVVLNFNIYNSGQSLDMINIRFNLSHQITYLINPILYLNGGNVGNNFIAELMEFGIFGVILGTIGLSIFINYLENNLSSNKLLRYLSMFFCMYLFIMPRAEFLFDTYTILKYLVIYFIFLFVDINYINRRINQYEQ